MTAVLEVLIAARTLIEDPSRWTRGTFARTKAGRPCEDGKHAIAWCAVGAVSRVSARLGYPKGTSEALAEAARRQYAMSISKVNDTLGHAAVLAVFDAAIADTEATP